MGPPTLASQPAGLYRHPMDRSFAQPGSVVELGPAECDTLLAAQPIGRVGFDFAGKPVILPVSYRYVDGVVVFRTVVGQKLHAAAAHRPVAFEVDGWDEKTRTGWSVLVKGTAEEIVDWSRARWADDSGLDTWADAEERDRWVRIVPEEITGRRIA